MSCVVACSWYCNSYTQHTTNQLNVWYDDRFLKNKFLVYFRRDVKYQNHYKRDIDDIMTLMLTKNNYSIWLMNIRARLREKNLWKYTQQFYRSSIVTKNKKLIDEQKTQLSKKKKKWVEKTMKAIDQMTSKMSTNVKLILENHYYNDDRTMWKRLQKLLQSMKDVQFMRLMKKFYSLKVENFSSMIDFLTHVKMLNEKIKTTKVELTENKQLIICMMMTLLESYQNLNQIWSMMPGLTAETTRNQLLKKKRRQQNQKHETFKTTTRRGQDEGGEKCSHCKRKMHPEKECWTLHPEKAPDWWKKKNDSNGGSSGGASGGGAAATKYAFSFGH